MTWTLATLPAEILNAILRSNDYSYLAIPLHQSGDKLLHSKLASGLTAISLQPDQCSFPAIPQMLNSLSSLRSLKLHSKSYLADDRDNLKSELEKLPKSLEALSLQSNDAIYILSLLASDHPAAGDLPPHSLLLPRLHALELSDPCDYSDFGSNMAMITTSLSRYPAHSLTRLTLPRLVSDGHLFECLPRSLITLDTSLRCQTSPHFLKDWLAAPPHLAHITKVIWEATEPLPYLAQCAVEVGSIQFFNWTFAMADNVPLNTRGLSFSMYEAGSFTRHYSNWAAKLPRRLERLDMGHDDNEALLAHTLDLPNSLTELNIHSRARDQVLVNTDKLEELIKEKGRDKCWPPNLGSLSIDRVSGDFAKLLPPSIKNLELIFGHTDALTLRTDDLPTDLSSLRLAPTTLAVVTLAGSNWPADLRSLRVRSELEIFDDLPASLTLLSLMKMKLPPLQDNPTAFPNGMKELNLFLWHHEWFGALPRMLTQFSATHLRTSSDGFYQAGVDAFAALPPSLTSLTLQKPGVPSLPGVFSADSFASLPNLVTVEITHVNKFKSGCLRNLTASLRTLHLPLEELEDKDVPFIPPNLRTFRPFLTLDLSAPLLLKHWPKRAHKV